MNLRWLVIGACLIAACSSKTAQAPATVSVTAASDVEGAAVLVLWPEQWGKLDAVISAVVKRIPEPVRPQIERIIAHERSQLREPWSLISPLGYLALDLRMPAAPSGMDPS